MNAVVKLKVKGKKATNARMLPANRSEGTATSHSDTGIRERKDREGVKE